MQRLITSYFSQVGNNFWRDLAVLVAGVLGAGAFTYLIIEGQVRLAIMLAFAVPLLGLTVVRIQAAILVAMAYLILVGDLRRLLIPIAGWSATDPLLLLGSVFAVFLCGFALASKQISLDTSLSRWVFALIVIMALQIFNPQQGGLIVGVAGAMFYIVPLLWYWVGRTYATEAFMEMLLYRVVLPLGILAMIFSFFQTFYGYLPYQQQWYNIAGYTALGPAFALKPLSFFASSTEHATFLSICAVLLWAAALRKRPVALVLVPLFILAVFFIGSRGPIVKILATAAALWAVLGHRRETWVLRGAIALLIGVVGLTWSLQQASQIQSETASVQFYMERQTDGLLNATSEGSSASGHMGMMLHGYKESFRNPLGRGLGSTTKAARKFGGSGTNMEVDSSNVFISTGVIGGVIYLIIIVWTLVTTVRYWQRKRTMLALGLMGLLAVTFFSWLSGQYAVTPLVWFSIGALDRLENVPRNEEDEAEAHQQSTQLAASGR